MQLSIVIPAYNEQDRLPRTLSLLESFFCGRAQGNLHLKEVIVVDDGSADATSTVVKAWPGPLPLRLIRFEKNRGKGAAAKAGMLAASGDCCLLYDADAATPVGEIPKLVEQMRRKAPTWSSAHASGADSRILSPCSGIGVGSAASITGCALP